MTEDQDPFMVFNEEEKGMSFGAKACITIALIIFVAVFYFNGTGLLESYKAPSPSENFSIADMQSKEVATEDVEDYLENKVGEEDEPMIEKVSSETTETDVRESSEQQISEEAVVENASVEAPVVAKKQNEIEEKIESVPADEKNKPDFKPVSIADNISYQNIQQPMPVKGDWKKQLPDFSKLTTTQRITPLENAEFQADFNDEKKSLSVSKTFGKPLFYFRRTHESQKQGAAKLGIVVYGLGLNEINTAYATNSLPPEVSLSFSVYSDKLNKMIENARKAGHETLLDIPLQSKDYPLSDPGKLGLLQSNIADDNKANLIKMLSNNVAVIGFFSINGDGFAISDPSVKLLSQELMTRGLMIYDANKESILSSAKGLDVLKASVVVDENMFKEKIIASLVESKQMALKNGWATIAIDDRPLSIYLLMDFIAKDMAGPDIELVPISFLLD